MNVTRVGILGTGDAGRKMGDAFLALGRHVMLGAREADNERAEEWVVKGGIQASRGTFADAARFGQVVVVATKGKFTEAAVVQAGADAFAHKVVIDLTNPLDYQRPQPPSLFVGTTDSLGEIVQRALPKAQVVKAFNSVGAMHFFRPEFPGGPPDMPIAGDDPTAKETVAAICAEFGWGCVDAGPLRSARWLEPLVLLWAGIAQTTNGWNHALKVLRK